jgi:hypothetical protein
MIRVDEIAYAAWRCGEDAAGDPRSEAGTGFAHPAGLPDRHADLRSANSGAASRRRSLVE